ncbi:MAG: hypothetical protein IJC72_00830 [Clostridia bacterium]|nr:hypothetical protein [Clostridia bacterium]
MVDIHTHVLPFVDDGSESYEESFKMLECAVKDGVTNMILTPHNRRNFDVKKEKLREEFIKFKAEVEKRNIPINLFLGQEIHVSNNYKLKFERDEVLSINDGKFLLIEFYFHKNVDMVEVVYELVNKGYHVIVAHLERYTYATLDDAVQIKHHGGFIQVNAASILGKNGFTCKSFAYKLLDRGLVDFVASDVHSNRKYLMKKAYDKVKKKYGEDVADSVFTNNAKPIIEG